MHSINLTWRLWLQRGLLGAAICSLGWLAGCEPNSPADRVLSVDQEQLVLTDQEGQERMSYKVATDVVVTLDGQQATLSELEAGDVAFVNLGVEDGNKVVVEIKASTPLNATTTEDAERVPTLPADMPPGEALDTSLHGLDLPADTRTLTNPQGFTDPNRANDDGDAALAPQDPEAGSPANMPQRSENIRADQTLTGDISNMGDRQFEMQLSENQQKRMITVTADTQYTLDGKEADWSALKNGQQVTVRLKGTETAIYVDAATPQ